VGDIVVSRVQFGNNRGKRNGPCGKIGKGVNPTARAGPEGDDDSGGIIVVGNMLRKKGIGGASATRRGGATSRQNWCLGGAWESGRPTGA